MKPSKLNPKVYLKAAEIQGRPDMAWGMCKAIASASHSMFAIREDYIDLLCFYFKENSAAYWYSMGDDGIFYDPEFHLRSEKGKLGRQLALLFMYEITKDELKIVKDENKQRKDK